MGSGLLESDLIQDLIHNFNPTNPNKFGQNISSSCDNNYRPIENVVQPINYHLSEGTNGSEYER